MTSTDTATLESRAEGRFDICAKAAEIHGWLEPVTARRTVDILRWQEASGITGNLLEVGVMCGKYFSLLVDSALRQRNQVLGIDTFQYTNTARVDREMEKALGASAKDAYTLWECMSSMVSAQDILDQIGQPRFISVDGAHDYENVYNDMEMADALLAPNGIVAADDFLNPLTLGVNQAVNAFLSRPRRMVPVAFIGNKLFLAHRSEADGYRAAIEDIFRAGSDEAATGFINRASHGRHHIEQPLHGHPVLIG
ncbi:MAG: class I SAM-dependent methyltransferase [Pseudomonadota bacterium]